MRLLKTHPILGLVNSYMVDSPQPANLSYMWNFGSLLGLCLVIQIITGVTLAMHYTPSVDLAFASVEHIMRDVNYGWLLRYMHANVASFFFIFVYLHIGRGLYYGSYRSPRTLPWSIGVIILVLMMATAFLGYVLPYGQMSLWGATVITNLMSAIPWLGQDIVTTLWGGFSVNNATLNRFFSLHFLLPFVLAALAAMHLLTLHEHGSSNPLGVSGNADRLPFHPYFVFKDLVTILLALLLIALVVFYVPNDLGHSDNYIMANPMQTPPSIVPEWYLLPFYAILRSIPNKLLGVIAMFASLLVLLAMPLLDVSRVRGSQFRPLMRWAFWIFVADFAVLMAVGQEHVEYPWITVGQVATVIYFGFFFVIVPLIGVIENTLMDVATAEHSTVTETGPVVNHGNTPFTHNSLYAGGFLLVPGTHVIPFDHNYSFVLFITGVVCFIFISCKFYYYMVNRGALRNGTSSMTPQWISTVGPYLVWTVVGFYVLCFAVSLLDVAYPGTFNAGIFYITTDTHNYFLRTQSMVTGLSLYTTLFAFMGFICSFSENDFVSRVSKRFIYLARLTGNVIVVALAIACLVDLVQMIIYYFIS